MRPEVDLAAPRVIDAANRSPRGLTFEGITEPIRPNSQPSNSIRVIGPVSITASSSPVSPSGPAASNPCRTVPITSCPISCTSSAPGMSVPAPMTATGT